MRTPWERHGYVLELLHARWIPRHGACENGLTTHFLIPPETLPRRALRAGGRFGVADARARPGRQKCTRVCFFAAGDGLCDARQEAAKSRNAPCGRIGRCGLSCGRLKQSFRCPGRRWAAQKAASGRPAVPEVHSQQCSRLAARRAHELARRHGNTRARRRTTLFGAAALRGAHHWCGRSPPDACVWRYLTGGISPRPRAAARAQPKRSPRRSRWLRVSATARRGKRAARAGGPPMIVPPGLFLLDGGA